jgi:predicted metal-dependent hydrolase
MNADWPERLPPDFYQGLEQFNQNQYYKCHETLEGLWLAERRSVRELYQGVLQIAVGCYHLTVRANFIGATRKLDEGARRLERTGIADEDRYGIHWSALIAEANRLREHLLELGSDHVSEHDRSLLPRVAYRLLEP